MQHRLGGTNPNIYGMETAVSILKTGIPIWEMVTTALEYSCHRLKTKNLLAMLTNGARFKRDEHFCQLSPIYQETAEDIETYIKECLSQPQ